MADEAALDAARNFAVRIAVDSWRFARVYEKAVSKLGAADRAGFEGVLAAFVKKIDEALGAVDMRIADIEGAPFDPGTAAIPINIEDFDPDDELMVDKMMEPVIMGRDGLVRMGVVTLRRAAP
jgi:hypothetical protein